MSRVKKIVISSIFIAFAFAFLFFFKPILSYGVSTYLNSFSKSLIKGSKVTFKDLEIKSKKITLNKVNVKADKKYEIEIDKIDIDFQFKIFKPGIIADININNPNITLFKNEKWDVKIPKKKSRFLSYFLRVNKGKVNFVNTGDTVKKICFDFSNHIAATSKLNLFLEENSSKKINIDINRDESKNIISTHLDEVDISNIGDILNFFNIKIFEDLKGLVNGIVVMAIENSKISSFFTNLDFINLSFLSPKTHLSFDCKTFKAEVNYPDFFSSNKITLLDSLKYDFLKETKIRLNFEDLRVLTSRKSVFSKIDGFFSYNPNLGSKLNAIGKIENEKTFDFQINSKAYTASSFSNWLDLECFIDDNKTKISLSAKEVEDYYNLHLSFQNIKSHIFEAFQDLLYKSFPKISDFKYVDGDVSFCIDSRFNEKGFNKIFVTDLSMKDLDFQKANINGFVSKIEGKSSFDITDDNFFDNFFADIKISNSNFDINQKKIKDFNAKIFAVDGAFESSSASCLFEKIDTKVDIKGPIKEFSAKISSRGTLNDFEETFLSEIICKRKGKEFHFSGNLQVSDSESAVFGFDLKKLLVFSFLDLKNNLQKGWLRAERINLNKWSKILGSDLLIDGTANIAAFYTNEKLSFQLKGENLSYESPYIDIKINKIGDLNDFIFENDNFISGTLSSKIINCYIPSFQGKCYLPKFDALFDLKDAIVQINQNVLKANLKTVSKDVDLDGTVFFDFSKNYPILNIETNYLSDIKSFQNLLKHFDFSNDLNLLGNVHGFSKITSIFEEETKTYYSLDFNFQDASYKINEKAILKNIKAKAKYSSDDDLTFSKLLGDLSLGNKTYQVSFPVFKKIKDEIDFDLRLEKDIFDFLRLKGKFIKQGDFYHLALDKELSALVGQKFKVLDFSIDENFNIDKLKLISNINSFAFISSFQFLLDFGLFGEDNLNILSLIQSKHSGDLLASINLDDNKDLLFDIESKNFQMLDKKFEKFSLKGKKSKSNLEIQKLSFDDIESSIFVDMSSEKLMIKDCSLKKKDELFLKMQGSYDQNLAALSFDISDVKLDIKKIRPLISNFFSLPKASIEGHLKGSGQLCVKIPKKDEKFNFSMDLDFQPSNLTIEKVRLYNNGSLNVHFASNTGFIIQGLDFSCFSKDIDLSYLTCKIGKASFDLNQKKYLLQDTNIYIPQSLKSSFEKLKNFKNYLKSFKLKDDIDLNCDIKFSSDLSDVEMYAKKAVFTLNTTKHELKDIFFNIRDKKCILNFDYFYKNSYYTIKNDFLTTDKIYAKTTLLEKLAICSNPLNISWLIDADKKFLIKEVIGNFCGIDFLFQEDLEKINSNNLFGSLKFNGSKLKKILPKNIENSFDHYLIGSGYEISGKLGFNFSKANFINFDGLFSGKDFELSSYQFKTMFSKLHIDEKSVKFTDFKVSDGSGIVMVNEMSFEKNKNKWQFLMPLLKIKDLRPSLLKNINQPLDEITPFLIRELVLKDFKGELGNKNSFSGNGNLHFINSFKRGQSVFDFPADVLSRIVGIDQELLTPVKGTVDFFVKNGKFNLSKLGDSFSEAERSKFFLLDKGQKPYVDFDGNIYINIAMKQYVLFKFTESFVISIRGNLEDPKCNLKKKRGFLN
ncbi:MAG: hypothetical protein K1060chlam1_01106 [Candidatus Anoxychlamydiales bacterium]|nr:hypothetical protein [Candidatus Anoxychlamydiales bacterium]